MTPEERIAAVGKQGFTVRQAGFLVTVMLHSGVCMLRQYGARWLTSLPMAGRAN